MTRNSLLITTALIIVASVSGVAAQPGASAGSLVRNGVVNRDTNDEFLCTYGQFNVSDYSSVASASSSTILWTHVAVPVIGRGQTVDRILVKEALGTATNGSEFSVGIYKSTSKGFPGTLLAGGTGVATDRCEQVGVPIAPTKLKKGRGYWIEEMAGPGGYPNIVYWAKNPRSKAKAYVQTYKYRHQSSTISSSTSHWTQQSSGPYFKLQGTRN
jgi:hypothetical protein